MIMVMISYNEALGSYVMDALARCALKNYTKLTNVFGKGTASGTHMGDDIWPGKNNVLYTACTESEAKALLSCVKKIRAELGKEGIKAFTWKLEEVT